jgi:hypothetical protein
MIAASHRWLTWPEMGGGGMEKGRYDQEFSRPALTCETGALVAYAGGLSLHPAIPRLDARRFFRILMRMVPRGEL